MIETFKAPQAPSKKEDYISRDAAIHEFKTIGNIFVYGRELCEAIISTIDSIPAADVRPVITCGECKHSDTFSPDCTEAIFPLKCLSIRYGGVYPNWFCEHGEKREES